MCSCGIILTGSDNMYDYLIGKITDAENNYVVIDINNIGYKTIVANPYSYELDKETKIYLYQHVREDEISLYGFKTKDERNMFLKLISVKGLGCKTALPMIEESSLAGIVDAIERENVLYLKKFPKIGDKVARQIILDLKGKLVSANSKVVTEDFLELTDTLKALGYKSQSIQKVLPNINKKDALEIQVKEALKLMLK